MYPGSLVRPKMGSCLMMRDRRPRNSGGSISVNVERQGNSDVRFMLVGSGIRMEGSSVVALGKEAVQGYQITGVETAYVVNGMDEVEIWVWWEIGLGVFQGCLESQIGIQGTLKKEQDRSARLQHVVHALPSLF